MSRQKRLAGYTKTKPNQTYFLTSRSADVEESGTDGICQIMNRLLEVMRSALRIGRQASRLAHINCSTQGILYSRGLDDV
jgi:hypothetical protein